MRAQAAVLRARPRNPDPAGRFEAPEADRAGDQRAEHAAANGHEQRAERLDARGNRIDRRLDAKGDRIDRRLDRRGERRASRRGD